MKWEYVMMKRPPTTFMDPSCHTDLNVMGRDGWELVGVYSNEAFIFKRPVEDSVNPMAIANQDFSQPPKADDERAFSLWLLNDPHEFSLAKVRAAYCAGLAEGMKRT